MPNWLRTVTWVLSSVLHEKRITAAYDNSWIYFYVGSEENPPEKREKYVQKLIYGLEHFFVFLDDVRRLLLHLRENGDIDEVEVHHKAHYSVSDKREWVVALG